MSTNSTTYNKTSSMTAEDQKSKRRTTCTAADLMSSVTHAKTDVSRVTNYQMLHKVKNSILRGFSKLKGQKFEKSVTVLESLSATEKSDELNASASYGTFESMLESDQCQDLAIQIKQALSAVQENTLGAQILVPCGLIVKVSREIMQMSRSEPCGLRGCVLFINLQGKDKCQKLVKLVCDPETVSTFELYLTLKEETQGWSMFKKLFITMSGCLEKKPWSSGIRMLCSGFNLEKKKLYRNS